MMKFFYYHIDLADALVGSIIPLAAVGLTLFANHSVYAILGLISTVVWAALCVSAAALYISFFMTMLYIVVLVLGILFISTAGKTISSNYSVFNRDTYSAYVFDPRTGLPGVIVIQATEFGVQVTATVRTLFFIATLVLVVRRMVQWYRVHQTNLLDSAWQYFLNALYVSLSPGVCLFLLLVHLVIVFFLHTPFYIFGCALLFIHFYIGTKMKLSAENRKVRVWYLTIAPIFIYVFWASRLNIGINHWYLIELISSRSESIGEAIRWIINGPGGGTAWCCSGSFCDGSCGGPGQVKPIKVILESSVKTRLGEDWFYYLKANHGAVMAAGRVIGGLVGFVGGKWHYKPNVDVASISKIKPPIVPQSKFLPSDPRMSITKNPEGFLEVRNVKLSRPADSVAATMRAAEAFERSEQLRLEIAEKEKWRQEVLDQIQRNALMLETVKSTTFGEMVKDAGKTVQKSPGVIGFILGGALAGTAAAEVIVKPPVADKP